jgi:molecular chaperone DnaJ
MGFEDIFNNIFGGGGTRATKNIRMKGEDTVVQLAIDFKEAVFGSEKVIAVDKTERCSVCAGSGAANSSAIKDCGKCRGLGQITVEARTALGKTRVSRPCPDCNGRGKIITEICRPCGGGGYVTKENEATVKIPAGIDTNQILTIKGAGEPGLNGGPPGDLQVVINVRPHPIFERNEADLHVEVPIKISEATLGAKIRVPSLHGEPTKLTVPSGTKSGDVLRVKGYGVKHLRRDAYGDLYVQLNVEMPKNITRKQAELLKRFEDSLDRTQYGDINKFRRDYKLD